MLGHSSPRRELDSVCHRFAEELQRSLQKMFLPLRCHPGRCTQIPTPTVHKLVRRVTHALCWLHLFARLPAKSAELDCRVVVRANQCPIQMLNEYKRQEPDL